MANTNVNFILHAHMPFVRHPEHERFLEEDWLFESINESYLPLLRMLNKLRNQSVNYKLTICFSPTLISMLLDPLLQDRYINYLKLHIELGKKEVKRCQKEQLEALEMAKTYLDNLESNLSDYINVYNKNILTGFKQLKEDGYLELLTSAATNSFFPVYSEYPIAINAQIDVGIQTFIEAFEFTPDGFWLPELGYYPGLEKILARHSISYVPASSQSVLFSENRCDTGVYRPVKSDNGVIIFPRDYQTTTLVWSHDGYPASKEYREFYRDIGYDLPLEYINDYIHEPDVRVFTGFKYFAITENGPNKQYYNKDEAFKVAEQHALNFVYNIAQKGRAVRPNLNGQDPLFTLCFDAELFGHWWYEGLKWLETILIDQNSECASISLVNPKDFIKEEGKSLQKIKPCLSSWSDGGYAKIWLDGSNNWIYRHTHKAIQRMVELAERFPKQQSLKKRFLDQAAREVLLSMACDWPYMLYNDTNSQFAKNQLVSHLANFNVVYSNMCKNAVNTEWLVKSENRDNIFPKIDYNIFERTNCFNS